MSDDESETREVSWREIFRQPPEKPPTLGLDFLRAEQATITVTYEIDASRGEGEHPQQQDEYLEEKEEATLVLAQRLSQLGIGAVVWDSVS